ncbi:MAG: hypothetical protein KatS3mg111_0933 [Pirellulaceae bacterium]|nr:MAG: hypothetical protein KatS3mg111_0933 [Pirellulaceae bacterium]
MCSGKGDICQCIERYGIVHRNGKNRGCWWLVCLACLCKPSMVFEHRGVPEQPPRHDIVGLTSCNPEMEIGAAKCVRRAREGKNMKRGIKQFDKNG